MEKTVQVLLKEQKEKLFEDLAKHYENRALLAIQSNEHNYNDCALIAKMNLQFATELRRNK